MRTPDELAHRVAGEELGIGVQDGVERLHAHPDGDAARDHRRVPGVEVEDHLAQQDRDERHGQQHGQGHRQVEELHELGERDPDGARALQHRCLTALGELEDGQEQRDPDALEDANTTANAMRPAISERFTSTILSIRRMALMRRYSASEWMGLSGTGGVLTGASAMPGTV
jgi:hypothetical protein